MMTVCERGHTDTSNYDRDQVPSSKAGELDRVEDGG